MFKRGMDGVGFIGVVVDDLGYLHFYPLGSVDVDREVGDGFW